MSQFLFVTWDGGGNLPPAMGIAQQLCQVGHNVTFAGVEMGQSPDIISRGHETIQARCEKRGFPFVRLERSTAACARELHGRGFVSTVMASAENLLDLPDALARESYDAVLIDCMMYGALLAAEEIALSIATLVHSAPSMLTPLAGRPPPGVLDAVNALRTSTGKATVASLWEAWAHFPTLCATIPELDPYASQVPASFEFVGPVFEQVPASGWRAPWPADDSRPLILVSFTSTGFWNQNSRIHRTLEALAGTAYRVLVTSSLTNVSDLSVPENALLIRQIPHSELMPSVAAVITHAGHGTVVASLAHGVPLVCLPNPAADQLALSAQVEALGAAIALDGEEASAAKITDAVVRITTQNSYQEAAKALAAKIATAPGAINAAARLVQLARPSAA